MISNIARTTIVLCCTLSALGTASPAAATCDPRVQSAPMALTTTGAGSLKSRFDTLYAMDKYRDAVPMAARWKALIDAASADPIANAEVLSRAYTGYAWVVSDTPQADQMVPAATKGEKIARDAGLTNRDFYYEALAILSAVETATGAFDAAAKHQTQATALAIAKFGVMSREAAFAEGTLGYLELAQGHYIEAERHYGHAAEVSLKCAAPDDNFTGTMIDTHAVTLDGISRFEEALTEHNRSLEWATAHASQDSYTLTAALGGVSAGLARLNRLAEAEPILREAIDRQRRYEPENYWNRAANLANYGDLLNRTGRSDEAEAFWDQARAFYAKAKTRQDPWLAAQPLYFSANAARARADYTTAIARYQLAEDQLKADLGPENVRLAGVVIEHAVALAASGRAIDGEKIATPAITLLRAKLEIKDIRRLIAEILYAKVIALSRSSDAGYAIILAPAKALEAKLLDAATSRAELVKYAPTLASAFGILTELSLKTGDVEGAFHALQLANLTDIVLVNSEVAARTAASNPQTVTAIRRLQDHIRLRQGLDKERSFAVSAQKSETVASLEAKIRLNDAQIATEGAEIDRLFPAYRALGRPTPVSLAAFQQRLLPGQVLLAPVPMEDGTLAITVTRSGVTWAKTTTTRGQIGQYAKRIRSSIDAARESGGATSGFDTAAARALYQAIVPPPLAIALRSHPQLLYYSSGALASIPPTLLITAPTHGTSLSEVAWLVRSHAVSVLPSLLVQIGSPRAMSSIPGHFLGVGAPTLGPAPVQVTARSVAFRTGGINTETLRALPSLPQAQSELRAIGTALGGHDDRLLIAQDATEARLRALPLDHYNVIAFATHGLVGGDFAGLTEPALVMTPPAVTKDGDDGLLTASEIAGLRLNADWVILSACNSASGIGSGGPAYGGLASAFMHAGARALLVSHWPVRDDAAERITVETVRSTRSGTPHAVALQRAILALMGNRRIPQSANPAIWAPFVLIER